MLIAVDFDGVPWSQVAPLESLGSVGVEREAIDVTHLSSPVKQVMKDVVAMPTMTIICGLESDDVGQAQMVASVMEDDNRYFRVVLPDEAERLFVGTTLSAMEVFDEAASVLRMSYAIAINSNIVRVAAEVGP